MNEKTYFIIGGRGRTATQWLTSAINRHPDILAAHGADWNPQKGEMDDPAKNHARREQVLDWLRSGNVMDIDRYFAIFASRTEAFCGNIHGIDIIGPYLYPQNFKTRLQICHITRHPVPRIQSMVWKCHKMGKEHPRHKEMMSEFYHQQVGKVTDILERYGVTPEGEDEENFVSCLLLIMSGDAAFLRTTAPAYKMEELISRPECFAALLGHITADRLRVTASEIDEMMRLKPIDQRNNNTNPAQVMEEWKDWQCYLFRNYLNRVNLKEIYAQYGYDVSI